MAINLGRVDNHKVFPEQEIPDFIPLRVGEGVTSGHRESSLTSSEIDL